jgi:two-component system, OmpR family, catabolic regulation response regulator CreB
MQRILVIEDEPAITDNISYCLTTEGFDVVCCATGQAGLKRFSQEDFSLIILDVGLPDKNGFEICREIRTTAATPIIFLTARSEEIDRVVGLELGADDYVVKPFSPRELAARVRAILRRAPVLAPSSDLPSDNPFEIDDKRHKVIYFGTPLELSRYEYRILTILINRPGWVFTRDQLMDQAWDEPEASYDRTVDAHIKTIRAKLRAVMPNIEAIETHRGVGYALKETW